MSTDLLPVPFHGHTLYVFDHDDQPHTPMKPITEGLGLAWQVQYRKLIARADRWGITIMVIPFDDGGPQRALVMPVRKLAGWLMTIHPAKVKPELRDTLLAYQRECDEVLWQHWRERYDAAAAAAAELDAVDAAAAHLHGHYGDAGFLPEVPPIQRPDHNLLREYRLLSPSLAHAYLVECGVTPSYIGTMLEGMPALPGSAPSSDVVPPSELVARLRRAEVPHDNQCWYVSAPVLQAICGGNPWRSTLHWLLTEGYLKHNPGYLTYRPPFWVGGVKRGPIYAIRKSLEECSHG